MEPEPKRRQLIPVVFEKNDASSSEMCESTESGTYSLKKRIDIFLNLAPRRRNLLRLYHFGRRKC